MLHFQIQLMKELEELSAALLCDDLKKNRKTYVILIIQI